MPSLGHSHGLPFQRYPPPDVDASGEPALVLEDGGFFLLEDGSGAILLEATDA